MITALVGCGNNSAAKPQNALETEFDSINGENTPLKEPQHEQPQPKEKHELEI